MQILVKTVLMHIVRTHTFLTRRNNKQGVAAAIAAHEEVFTPSSGSQTPLLLHVSLLCNFPQQASLFFYVRHKKTSHYVFDSR